MSYSMELNQRFYEGYLSAKYGTRDEQGHILGYFELAKEMAACTWAKSYDFWPLPIREHLITTDMERNGQLNGQQLRALALKHLTEIDPQSWENKL